MPSEKSETKWEEGKRPRGGGGEAGAVRGWSNGGKNQNPQKSLEQKLTLNKSHVELPSLKNFH